MVAPFIMVAGQAAVEKTGAGLTFTSVAWRYIQRLFNLAQEGYTVFGTPGLAPPVNGFELAFPVPDNLVIPPPLQSPAFGSYVAIPPTGNVVVTLSHIVAGVKTQFGNVLFPSGQFGQNTAILTINMDANTGRASVTLNIPDTIIADWPSSADTTGAGMFFTLPYTIV